MASDDYYQPPQRSQSHSGQWGLAAILLSALVLILFPISVALLFGSLVGMNRNPDVRHSDVDLGVISTYVLSGGIIAMALFALLCAFIGFLSGLIRRQPLGLSFAGGFVGLIALALGVLLFAISLRCIEWARDHERNQMRHDGFRQPFRPGFR